MTITDHQDIKAAIQNTTASAVLPMCSVLSIAYAVLAFAHPLLISGDFAWHMSFLAAASALTIFQASRYWRKRGSDHLAHPMMAMLALIILLNVIVNSVANPEIERSIFFIAYLIIVSLLVLSRRLFFSLLVCGLVCWVLLVSALDFEAQDLRDWAWLVFFGALIAVVLNGQRERAALRAATQEMQLRKHGRQLSELLKANELALADSNGMFQKLAQASFEELGVHRFGIWLFNSDEMELECQYFKSSLSEANEQGAVLQRADMPAYFDSLQENRIISAEDAVNDQRTFELAGYLQENNIDSMLDGPIVVRGQVVGVVCNESVGAQKRWTVEEQTFAASVADIAALVIQSRERAELERRTVQAERFESLGILAGGVAHDFNNILTVVLGHTEILQSMLADNPEALDSVQSIARAGENAKDLASHMLNYSGRGTFLTRIVNLTDVVGDFCADSGSEFLEDGILQLKENDQVLPVKLESSKIQQVLLNLVINARDASATKITLSTGEVNRVDLPVDQLVITEELSAERYAWFEVSDNGTGMSHEALNKMFDPFYTTKEFGSGLGLANVLGILRAHFGSILVDTRVGAGTSIRVYLPLDNSELPEDSTVDRTEPEPADRSYRVLLVEDENRVREITRRLLEDRGSEVIAFESYTDFATRLVEVEVNQLDVALVDLTLGDGDGVQVITLLHRINPDLPVVLMSGYDAGSALTRLESDSNVVFLQKPFVTRELMEALAHARK